MEVDSLEVNMRLSFPEAHDRTRSFIVLVILGVNRSILGSGGFSIVL